MCFTHCNMLQHAKTRREAIGVELYNFQQQLAKMQMQLETAQENYAHISQIRQQAEEQLHSLQKTHAEEEQFTSQERLKVVFYSLYCLEMQYCVCALQTIAYPTVSKWCKVHQHDISKVSRDAHCYHSARLWAASPRVVGSRHAAFLTRSQCILCCPFMRAYLLVTHKSSNATCSV